MQKITLTIYHDALKRDVVDKATKLAKLGKYSTGNPDTVGEDFEQDTQFDGTIPDDLFMNREFQNGLSTLLVDAERYMYSTDTEADNRMKPDANYVVTMAARNNWNNAMARPMANLMHAYMVAMCMVEWFRYTRPSESNAQLAIAQEHRKNFNKAVRSRARYKKA